MIMEIFWKTVVGRSYDVITAFLVLPDMVGLGDRVSA